VTFEDPMSVSMKSIGASDVTSCVLVVCVLL
jgi:hypothetical protein